MKRTKKICNLSQEENFSYFVFLIFFFISWLLIIKYVGLLIIPSITPSAPSFTFLSLSYHFTSLFQLIRCFLLSFIFSKFSYYFSSFFFLEYLKLRKGVVNTEEEIFILFGYGFIFGLYLYEMLLVSIISLYFGSKTVRKLKSNRRDHILQNEKKWLCCEAFAILQGTIFITVTKLKNKKNK